MGRSRLSMAQLGKRGGKAFVRGAQGRSSWRSIKLRHTTFSFRPTRSRRPPAARCSLRRADQAWLLIPAGLVPLPLLLADLHAPTLDPVSRRPKQSCRRPKHHQDAFSILWFQLCINCACASIALCAASLSPRLRPPPLISGEARALARVCLGRWASPTQEGGTDGWMYSIFSFYRTVKNKKRGPKG